MRWETDSAEGGRGTRMQQNSTSEQTQKANFDFVPPFAGLPLLRRLWLFPSTPLFKLSQFTSSCFLLFYIRSYLYLQTFHSFVETAASPSVGPGVSPRCVSAAGGCHTAFSAASPSEMSCPVRKIVKPSRS